MFSSKAQLMKRTPENGTDRESFLSLLVDEYLHSSSYDSKCQVLANLANFAYDPINYQYIRDVGVLDIFIHVLKNENNDQLLRFAVAGVCNLCCDPLNADYILSHCGLKPFITLLQVKNSDLIADTITSLIQLNECGRLEINTGEVVPHICNIKKSDNKILSNLATIFLQNVCRANVE